MNEMTSCLHVRQSLGVYVVGAIDPAERSAVDAHLAGCPDCREELAGLAGLPALLGRVPAEEAERIAGFYSERTIPSEHPDIELLNPLLARVARRRRVRAWRSLAAVAAVALIAAGTAIGAIHVAGGSSGGSAGNVHWETVAATNAVTRASADVKYAGAAWGTRLDVQVSGIPANTTCEFWVTGANGQRWPAGGWTEAYSGRSTWYQETSAAPVNSVSGFEITSGSTVLVHLSAT
jgi:anti-sigma factor RsiW